MDRILRRVIGPNAIKEHNAMCQWNRVVGESISQFAVPTRVVNGVLHVSVVNSVWRQELMMRKNELLRKYKLFTGQEIIKDIIFH